MIRVISEASSAQGDVDNDKIDAHPIIRATSEQGDWEGHWTEFD